MQYTALILAALAGMVLANPLPIPAEEAAPASNTTTAVADAANVAAVPEPDLPVRSKTQTIRMPVNLY